jgi:hypothetical protein
MPTQTQQRPQQRNWNQEENRENEMSIKSVAKDLGKDLVSVLDFSDMLGLPGSKPDPNAEQMRQVEKAQGKKQNHTPLDFARLMGIFQQKEADPELEATRKRLFNLVTSGTEQAIQKNKQKEEEKKRQEAYEEQEKKRREQQAQQNGPSEVSGKAKGRLGAARKKASTEETKQSGKD